VGALARKSIPRARPADTERPRKNWAAFLELAKKNKELKDELDAVRQKGKQ